MVTFWSYLWSFPVYYCLCSAEILPCYTWVLRIQKADPPRGTGCYEKVRGPGELAWSSCSHCLCIVNVQVLSVFKGRRSYEGVNMKGLALIMAVISKFGPSSIFPILFFLIYWKHVQEQACCSVSWKTEALSWQIQVLALFLLMIPFPTQLPCLMPATDKQVTWPLSLFA